MNDFNASLALSAFEFATGGCSVPEEVVKRAKLYFEALLEMKYRGEEMISRAEHAELMAMIKGAASAA